MIWRMAGRDDLNAMITGYRISSALAVAADLGLSDHLSAGPHSVADLASAVSADADTLHRLLRALSTVGVYRDWTTAGSRTPRRVRVCVPTYRGHCGRSPAR